MNATSIPWIVRSLVFVLGLALGGLLLAAGMEVQAADAAILAELYVLAALFGAISLATCRIAAVHTLYPPLAVALTAAGLLWPQSPLAAAGPAALFGIAWLVSIGPSWGA